MDKKELFKLYLLGFVIALILNIFPTCKKEESPTQPPEDQPPAGETIEMKNLSYSLQAAFNSSDKNKVLSCMSDESREIYSQILNNSNADMVSFGTALEKRRLIFSSSLLAEYELEINGEVFTITYGSCGDGKWKLIRL